MKWCYLLTAILDAIISALYVHDGRFGFAAVWAAMAVGNAWIAWATRNEQ